MNDITAIIPAAGLGTRALPNSYASPKELAAVYAKPAIQWVVEECVAAGIGKIVVVVSDEKDAIRRYFEDSEPTEMALRAVGKGDAADLLTHVRELGSRMRYVHQHEPHGLGHAVLMAEPVTEGPFVVVTPDDLWLPRSSVMTRLVRRQQEIGQDHGVIAVRRVPMDIIDQYGCPRPLGELADDASYASVTEIVEKPSVEEAPSNLAAAGRWLLPHRAFEILDQTTHGSGGEIQLTDALATLADEGLLGVEIFAEGLYFDVGNPLGLVHAGVAFAAEEREAEREEAER